MHTNFKKKTLSYFFYLSVHLTLIRFSLSLSEVSFEKVGLEEWLADGK